MQHLDLTALRYFAEAAACGSIRQAADRLHVTASAISRQIAKLEYRLDTELLERRASGVTLTAAGRLLAEEVRRIDRSLLNVRDRIADLDGLRRGEVTICCMEGAVDAWLPAALRSFHERHPGIIFRLRVANTDASLQALLTDEGDLAITFKTRHHPEISVLKRRTAAMVALVAPGHVLAAEKSIDFARLLTHPLVLPDPTFGVRQLVDAHAKRLRLPLRLIAETNSVAMTRSLARQGLGATVLPLFSVTQDLRQGTLEVVPIDDAPQLRATIHLCARKDLTPSAATKAVAQVLADTFDTLFPDAAHPAR